MTTTLSHEDQPAGTTQPRHVPLKWRTNLARVVLSAFIVVSTAYVVVYYHASAFPVKLAMSRQTIRIVPVGHPVNVSRIAVGVNNAVWDPHLNDSGVSGILSRVGAKILRFPGGTTSDVYHWQTNSITPHQPGFAEAKNTFDDWMSHVVLPSGARAMVTVNYGTNAEGTGGGDPAEAAAWVNYANNQMRYGVKYWEIGNEVYGNGYYGSPWNWEADLHADKSPAAYATNLAAYSRAMKAVDPAIKIGASLVAPGVPPDGGGPEPWNSTVLSQACKAIDFVSVHWYPELPSHESDAQLLASTRTIPSMMRTLHGLIHRYCGVHAAKLQIMVTETNSVAFNPGKQTTSGVSALYLADDYLTWLQVGATNVDWWDLHDGPNPNGNLNSKMLGTARYGDFGLVSSGGRDEPPLETAFPAFSALGMVASVAKHSSHFARVNTRRSSVKTFALLRPHAVDVVLVNTSRVRSFRLTLELPRNRRPLQAKVTVYSSLDLSKKITTLRLSSSRVRYILPPYTLVSLAVQTR